MARVVDIFATKGIIVRSSLRKRQGSALGSCRGQFHDPRRDLFDLPDQKVRPIFGLRAVSFVWFVDKVVPALGLFNQ